MPLELCIFNFEITTESHQNYEKQILIGETDENKIPTLRQGVILQITYKLVFLALSF